MFIATLVAVGAIPSGCAQPRGPLFTDIEPARVWPAPPDSARIKLVGVIAGSKDLNAEVTSKEAFLTALRGPRPPIKFSGPHSVAVRDTSMLAVADAAAAAVHIIDLDERTHTLVSGFGGELFQSPLGVAWAGDRLFVTDAQLGEVIELSSNGAFRRRFGASALERPVGIAYASQRDRLYVVDGDAHSVVTFDSQGRAVGSIGGPGSADGLFNYPTHVACTGERLLVADSGNFRVQLLDLDGVPIRTIGKKGNAAGDFSLPKGVAFDSEGHIYVVDTHFENVQVFDDAGRLLMAFGGEGRNLGSFWLPAGLSIDAADRIWVADAGNRRLQVFAYMRAAS